MPWSRWKPLWSPKSYVSAVSLGSLALPCGNSAASPKQRLWPRRFKLVGPYSAAERGLLFSITGPIIQAHLLPPKSQWLRRHPWCLINKAGDSRRLQSCAEYISLTLRQPAWLRGSDVFFGACVLFDHLSRQALQISPGVFDGGGEKERAEKSVLPPFIKLKQGPFFFPSRAILPSDR